MRPIVRIMMPLWLLLCGASAMAASDPTPDRIGVYFDAEAAQRTEWVGAGEIFHMYITVTNPTFSNIYGWQAAIRGLDPQYVQIVGTTITGGAHVSGPELQFDVVYETPLLAQPVTVLASIVAISWDWYPPHCLVLTGVDQPAIPEMLPLVWMQPDQPSAIQVARLYSNGIAAAINESPIPEDPGCSTVVAVEPTSWSTLKALFR